MLLQANPIRARMGSATSPLGTSPLRKGGTHMFVPGKKLVVRMVVAVVLAAGLGSGPAWGQATGVLEAPEAEVLERTSSGLTQRRQEWLRASEQERKRIIEQIGEEGARQYAATQGWQPIYDGQGRKLPQGPDQVYWDPKTGKTIVIEAKGGKSRRSNAYGYQQGTPEWTVKSAENVLHHQANASEAERKAAKQVIEAARQGNLEVQVVRTEYELGEPKAPKVESITECTPKAKELAEEVAKRYKIGQHGFPRPTDSKRISGDNEATASSEPASQTPLNNSNNLPGGNGRQPLPDNSKNLAGGNGAAKGQQGMKEHAAQESSVQHALEGGTKSASSAVKKAGSKLSEAGSRAQSAAGQTAKSVSKAGGKAASGVARSAGAASEASSTLKSLGQVGKAAGTAAVALDAGFRIYEAYEVEKAYQEGRISDHERVKSHVKNGASAVGGYTGGYVGAQAGAAAGAAIGTAICPGIGTAIGGVVGGIAGAIGGYWAGDKAAGAAVDYAMGP